MERSFARGAETRGIGYPISKGRDGYWPRRNAAALRQSSIINILTTRKGERVMLPEFGSELPNLIFEPNDDILVRRVADETKGALQRWDPYIKVVAVSPEIEDNQVRVFIDYIDLRSTTEDRSRVVLSLRRS